MKYSMVCLFILSFCFSCNYSREKNISDSDNNKFTAISIIQGLENRTEYFKLSDIAKDIEIIPLETCPQTLFKFIDNIIVTENDIFVNTRISVLRFDRKTGNFKNPIGAKGQGPTEFLSCAGIGVNENTKNVYVFSSEDNKVKSYSYDGAFLTSIQLAPRGESTIGSQHEENRTYTFFDNKHVLRRMLPLSDGSKDFWLVQIQNLNGTVLSRFYDPLNVGFENEIAQKQVDNKNIIPYYWSEDSPVLNRFNNFAHFLFDSNDTIYKYDETEWTLKPHYILDCGSRPSISAIRQMSKERDFFDYTFVKNMWDTKDFLFLLSEQDRYTYLLRYDKTTKNIVSIREKGEIKKAPIMKILYRDAPMPRFTNDLCGGLGFYPYFQNNSQWITMFDAEELLTIDLNSLKRDSFILKDKQEQLIRIIENINEDDNPIIMIVTLKQ